MDKAKQIEHKPELIELLLTQPINPNNKKGNPVLSINYEKPIGFAEKFSQLLNETPNIGSTSNPEFFIYVVLGSVLMLPNSGLMQKLGIDKVYAKHVEVTTKYKQRNNKKVKFTSNVVKLCFSLKKDGREQIAFRTFASDKIEHDVDLRNDEYRYSDEELKEIAEKLGIHEIDNISVDEHVFRICTQQDSGSISFVLHEERIDEVKEKFKAATSSTLQTNDFKEISIGQSKSLEGSFKKLSNPELDEVMGSTEKILGGFGEAYRGNQGKLSLSKAETGYHGFVYGALALNFKYRYGLNCYVERIAGKGRADLVLISRTKDSSGKMEPKPIPIVVEFKAGNNPASEAIKQIKNRGYLYNLGIRTKAEDAVIVGVNFASSDKFRVEQDKIFQSRGFLLQLLEDIQDFDGSDASEILGNLNGELKNLYYSIPGNDKNYLSKLVLGQVLAESGAKLDKYIFSYKGKGIAKFVTTLVLCDKTKRAVLLNVIELSGTRTKKMAQKQFDSEKIPSIDDIGVSIKSVVRVDVMVKADLKGKERRFEVEEDEKNSYFLGIEIEEIPGHEIDLKGKHAGKWKKINDVDVSKLIQGLRNQKQPEESLSDFKRALFPLKELITQEKDLQGVMQGLFMHRSSLGGKDVRVYSEFNPSSKGRVDLALSFAHLGQGVYLNEEEPIIIELKYTNDKNKVETKLDEAEVQLADKYTLLRSFTDSKTARFLSMVFCSSPKNLNPHNLIRARIISGKIDHTSQSAASERVFSSPERKSKGIIPSNTPFGSPVGHREIIERSESKIPSKSDSPKPGPSNYLSPGKGYPPSGSSQASDILSPDIRYTSSQTRRRLSTVGEDISSSDGEFYSLGCSPSKRPRKERNIDMACIDSRDEEKITEEEKEQLIKELFGSDMAIKKIKNIEFYGQLFKIYERISKGEAVDQNIEKAFVAKIKDIDLGSIDPEIRDIMKEIKENKEEIKNILRRSGVAEKIGKVAEGSGLAFTAFLVGKHIANGDIEGLGYDALNLWVMPKIGEEVSGKMLKLGTKLDSQMLKGFAPVVGRTIGNFAAFLGLIESIKARQNATDPVDIKVADLNIATNSIFLAADVPGIFTETMSIAGLETGVVGEFAGPVGAAVSVAVIVTSQFIEAGLEVEKLEEQMNLTDQEKHDLYWDLFLGKKVPHYIEDNMEVKERYKQYISKIVDKFKNDYSRIAISLPPISVKKIEYATNNQLRQKKRGVVDDIDNQMKHLFDACRIRTQVVGREFDFNFTATMSSSNIRYTGHYSRMVPHSFENYNVVCGSYSDNIKEQEISRETWHKLPSEALCDDSSPNKNKILSTVKEKWSLQEYPPHCQNVIVYENKSPHKYKTDMYYIKSLYTDMRVSEEDSLTVIFGGTNISISDLSEGGSDKVENRYYFMESLESCDVQKSGSNFFYIRGNELSCNLGINRQKNIVIVKVDFIDSKNIHSVIGSNEANHIEVSHASYVDGKGGNDVITAKNFTIIKGYFGDSIHGKGLVLLPINFSDIGSMTHANNTTNIYNKRGVFISVDKQTLVKTADGLFVTPTKVDTNTDRVTNLHIMQLDDDLDNLRKIDNSNFNVTKQLSSASYHSTIGSSSNYIFYRDKEHHNFYWEAPSNISHLYLFDERNANITIAQANGILDFSQLNSTLEDMPFIENDEGEMEVNKNGLSVTLLSDYKDVIVTFDGEEYYKLQNGELERDYCSHSLKIDGRFSVNGTDLLNYHNCFIFDSDKVLFLKLNNDLLLLSDRGALSISDYYSSVHKNWDLSIELSDKIIEPEEFGKRAGDFSSFRYYKPDERGLQIYHNQPINKNDIGLVDLKDKSILDFNMKVINDNLLLSHKNNTLVEVESWSTYQPAREMMFAFNDTIVSNSKCIASACNSEDVIVEFNKEKAVQLIKQVFDAVRQNNLDKVSDLISQGANISAKEVGIYGKEPIHIAAENNNKNIIEFLLSKGVRVDETDRNGWTPLHWAASNGYLGIIEYLVGKGADINAKDKNGKTPLDIARDEGHNDVVEYLQQTQLVLYRQLLTAVQGGDLNKVKDLVKQGANLEAKNNNGMTFLHYASQNGHAGVVEYLIREGANIDAKDNIGRTPLHCAARNGHLSIVQYVIAKGADFSIKDKDGKTPLDLASWKAHDDVVQYLNIMKQNGWTALHWYACEGDLPRVMSLVDEGANIDAKDNIGRTPLHCAARNGHLSIVQYVIGKDADFSIEDKDGKTALDLASWKAHNDTVNYLNLVKKERGKPVQRERRRHHGDQARHHISRKPLAVGLNSQPEIATSSSIRLSSRINDLFGWIKSSIGGLFNSKAALVEERLKTTSSISQVDARADVNGTIMLLDVLVRKVTGQKYISTVDQPISPLEAQGYALNITQKFEKVMEQAAKDSKISIHRLEIDLVEIQREVTGKIMSGKFNEVSGILSSYVEKACPGREADQLSLKKFDKFMAEFDKALDTIVNQPMQQILNNGNSRLEANGVKKQQMNSEPKSYLSNTSIQSYSKDKISTYLSDIGVTKFGSNLSR